MSSNDGVYDLSPDKRTLRSLRSDVTPITAVEELVDNVLDNWRRIDDSKDDVTIDVDVDFANGIFRIEDDSGGLNEQNVKKIFALGGSTKEEIPNSIGSYGMGAKKAILRLGNRAEIKSRAIDAEIGYGFVIDEEWLRSDSWQVRKQTFDDLDQGTTVIHIEGLSIEFLDKEEDGEDGDTPNFQTPDEFLDSLRDDLSETYDEFLTGRAGPENGKISIKVNGKRVKKLDSIDWSFTPFDGYHPRFYQQYEISPDEIPNRDEPISVDITAGLMRSGKTEEAGTDIIIQNRRILTSNKGEMGGWGTYLPSFRANLRRTRFVVKITAENNPETLPWDTQKDRIEPNSIITDRVFNVLQRAGEEYAKVTYENFPIPYTGPFNNGTDEEGHGAVRNEIESLDYSDRSLFIADHKPDSTLPETNQVTKLIEYHKETLGVFAPHVIADPFVRSYQASFDPSNEANGNYIPDDDKFWIVPEAAEKFPEQELHLILETIKDTAERHRQNGVTISFDESPWWRDYYKRVQQEDGTDLEELDSTEERERIEHRIEIKGEEEDLPESILKSEGLRPSNLFGVFSDAPNLESKEAGEQAQLDLSEPEAEPDADEDDPGAETDNAEQNSTASEEEEEQGGQDDEGDDDGALDFGTTVERGTVQQTLSDDQSILLRISLSAYEEICLELGLDSENASPAVVGQAVLDQDLDIREFVDSTNLNEE